MTQTFHDHFSGVAARYADFRPQYPGGLFDFLAGLTPAKTLAWDCACGNGQAALDLADRFHCVVATDASEAQIKAATPHPKVEYRVAPAERSGLADASVALVTVAQALHWFDLPKFFTEAERVLVPGGVLAAWAYGVQSVDDPAVNELVLDYYSNVVGAYWPPERLLVEQGYRGIPFPLEECAAPAFGMEANWSLDQLLGYFSTWSATNRCLKATGVNPLVRLEAALAPVWGDRSLPRRVSWPLALRVSRKSWVGTGRPA